MSNFCKCAKGPASSSARSSGCGERDPCIRNEPTVDWYYVGKGKGHYEKNVGHVYVGSQLGEYERRPVLTAYGWKFRRGFLELFVAILCVVTVATVWILTRPSETPEGNLERAPAAKNDAGQNQDQKQRANPELYNCSSVLYLDVRKMSFCCEQYGIFCEQTKSEEMLHEEQIEKDRVQAFVGGVAAAPSMTTTREASRPEEIVVADATRHEGALARMDCETDFGDWVNKWSIVQKFKCCRSVGRGCPPKLVEHSKPEVVDCSEGWDSWQEGWSVRKKNWCCLHEHRGCEDQQPATTMV